MHGGDSIITTSRACSSIPVFRHPGIILAYACTLVMSYTLKEKAGKWHETNNIIAAISACVDNCMKKFIAAFLYDFSSFMCVCVYVCVCVCV